MKYTILGSEVNDQIQNIVDVMVDEVRKNVPGVLSIILGGGFGKGEGSVQIKEGKVIPVNDFDAYIITEGPVDDKLLNDVANKATARLTLENKGLEFYEFDRKKYADTFYLDLKAIPVYKLKDLPPMTRYFEIKNASSVVYGQDYRYLMPDYDFTDIPQAEGFRVLLNRMAHLAEYFSTDFLTGNITPGEYKGLRYIAHTKAFIACGEGLLTLNKKFVPTYSGRAAMLKKCYKHDFPDLYEKLPNLANKVEAATNFKLKADFEVQEDPFMIYQDVASHIGEVTKYFVSKFSGINIENYHQLSQVIYKKVWPDYFGYYAKWFLKHKTGINFGKYLPAYLAKQYMTWVYYLRLKNYRGINHKEVIRNPASPDITMYAAIPELIYSLRPDKTIDRTMLDRAAKLTNKVFPTKLNISDDYKLWNHVALQFSNAYVLFGFLKIV